LVDQVEPGRARLRASSLSDSSAIEHGRWVGTPPQTSPAASQA
jgi:hypothetical protein